MVTHSIRYDARGPVTSIGVTNRRTTRARIFYPDACDLSLTHSSENVLLRKDGQTEWATWISYASLLAVPFYV